LGPPPSWERTHGLRNALLAAAAILLVGSLIAAFVVWRNQADDKGRDPGPPAGQAPRVTVPAGAGIDGAALPTLPVVPPVTVPPAPATTAATTPPVRATTVAPRPAPTTTRPPTPTTRATVPTTTPITASPPVTSFPPPTRATTTTKPPAR